MNIKALCLALALPSVGFAAAKGNSADAAGVDSGVPRPFIGVGTKKGEAQKGSRKHDSALDELIQLAKSMKLDGFLKLFKGFKFNLPHPLPGNGILYT